MSANAGWFPDPTGRFGQRWYDGHRWSDQVVAADGSAIEDALPERSAPYPPPQLSTVVRPTPPAVPASTGPSASAGRPATAPPAAPVAPVRPPAPPFQPPGQKVRLMPGATLAIGVLGLFLVVLSLFVLPWASATEDVTFLDFSEAVRDNGDGLELIPRVYGAFLGFVLFVGAIVGVTLAGIPLPATPTGVTIWRIIASAGSGLAAVLHTVTVVRIFQVGDPEIAAWLGTVGYFVIILAMVIGHYTRRRPPIAPPTAGLAP